MDLLTERELNRELDLGLEKIERENNLKREVTPEELIEVLSLTIKEDELNKLVVFLGCLSTYTENNQFNISFNAPSSTGKTYIPLEISSLFPREDIIIVGYCSPMAFFHEWGKFDKDRRLYCVDLERKILIFLDQPQPLLLEKLRPLLSHDKKEIEAKIVDKKQKYGMRTKSIVLRGYSSVIFCSARLKMDEQEATRFILLSPETTQSKIKLGIKEVLKKAIDRDAYFNELNSNPQRKGLIERIRAIKEARITDIKIHDPEKIKERFLNNKMLKPRNMRDIDRIISIIKGFTLLNLSHRRTDNPHVLITNDGDIEQGFKVWDKISYCQELNLPPYAYGIFKEIIAPFYQEKKEPLTRKEILQRHLSVYQRPLQPHRLDKEILPMLEDSGLINQEPDPDDKRVKLIIPTLPTSLDIPFIEEKLRY